MNRIDPAAYLLGVRRRTSNTLAVLVVALTGCAEGDYDELPVASFGGVHDADLPPGEAFVARPDLGTPSDIDDDTETTSSESGESSESSESSESGGDAAAPSGCCAPRDQPLCDDIDVFGCVCHVDPSCCVNGWDETCVAEVMSLGCGQC